MGIIEQILLTSIFCVGLKITYMPNHIFGFFGKWLDRLIDHPYGYYIAKPLGACIYCMASFYGLVFHLFLWMAGMANDVIVLLVVLPSVIVLNGIFYGILNKLDEHLFK